MARTAKDESAYVQHLREEEPIKTEVIVELKTQNSVLWETQARLLEDLITAQDRLRIYRLQALKQARAMVDIGPHSHCLPGCTRHVWDSVDGWKRKDKKEA